MHRDPQQSVINVSCSLIRQDQGEGKVTAAFEMFTFREFVAHSKGELRELLFCSV